MRKIFIERMIYINEYRVAALVSIKLLIFDPTLVSFIYNMI